MTKDYFDARLGVEFGRFREQINDDLAGWKDEIFNLVDDLAEEIRDGREHRQITAHQIADHEQRVSKLENTAMSN